MREIAKEKLGLKDEIIESRRKDYKEEDVKRGWIINLSNKWGVSHTQVKRFIDKYCIDIEKEKTHEQKVRYKTKNYNEIKNNRKKDILEIKNKDNWEEILKEKWNINYPREFIKNNFPDIWNEMKYMKNKKKCKQRHADYIKYRDGIFDIHDLCASWDLSEENVYVYIDRNYLGKEE